MSKPLCHMSLAADYRGGERQAEILLRELESLHGQKVVCRTADGKAFGECVFPDPGPPKP